VLELDGPVPELGSVFFCHSPSYETGQPVSKLDDQFQNWVSYPKPQIGTIPFWHKFQNGVSPFWHQQDVPIMALVPKRRWPVLALVPKWQHPILALVVFCVFAMCLRLCAKTGHPHFSTSFVPKWKCPVSALLSFCVLL
jgi:hypothetical protein